MASAASNENEEENGETLKKRLTDAISTYSGRREFEEIRPILLEILQKNDCREIFAEAVVTGDTLTNALSRAAFHDHVDVLQVLLDHGMEVDRIDNDGNTALMLASQNGHEESVRVLLDHNAFVDTRTYYDSTALMFACESDHAGVVEMLLQKNANPDLQDRKGVTALINASRYNNFNAVEVLLKYHADVDLTNKNGKTALDLTDDDDIKELLMNHVSNAYVLK